MTSLSTQLNRLNQNFYQQIAGEFSQTRQTAWPGWEWLSDRDKATLAKTSRVVDLGCGNGRFGIFLLSKKSDLNYYLGSDSNSHLLAEAARQLQPLITHINLMNLDLVELSERNPSTDGSITELQPGHIVAAFGIWHHLPSHAARVGFLNLCRGLLLPSGSIWLSAWEFTQNQTLMKRSVLPSKAGIQIKAADEWNSATDFILDWQRGSQAFRYCHFSDQSEMKELFAMTKLNCLDSFQPTVGADKHNRYYLLKPAV